MYRLQQKVKIIFKKERLDQHKIGKNPQALDIKLESFFFFHATAKINNNKAKIKCTIILFFRQTILHISHICVPHLGFLLCQRLPIKRLPPPADPLAHSVE